MYENMYETAATGSEVKIANGGADTRIVPLTTISRGGMIL